MALKLSKKNSKVQKVVKKARRSKPVNVVTNKNNNQASDITLPTGTYTEAVGRRKVATARVRLFESGSDFFVNGQTVAQYFTSVPNAMKNLVRPLDIAGVKGKFTVSVNVKGSGQSAQVEAIIHGLSRALVKHDPENRALLKQEGLLTRDARMKETRKIGMGGKARRKRQSPKR